MHPLSTSSKNILKKEAIAYGKRLISSPQCFHGQSILEAAKSCNHAVLGSIFIKRQLNSLPNDKILDQFKFKELADQNKCN